MTEPDTTSRHPDGGSEPVAAGRKLTFGRLIAFGFGLVLLFALYEWLTFPDVAKLRKENPDTTAFQEARKAELRGDGKSDKLLRTWVPYNRISPNLRRAVIVSEDSAFFEHEGVDVEQLKKSFEEDLEKKKISRGGSTITQQLAKNLYLSPSKNPWRKVKELLLAKALERELTKKRILEIYLNVVEFGERVYGAEAASRFYFHKPASALSEPEAALLAGCLPNPRKMVPGAPNKRLRARQRIILARMNTWGRYIEQQILAAPPPPAAVEDVATETAAPAATTDPGAESSAEPATSTDAVVPASPPPVTSTDTAPPPSSTSTEPPPDSGP